MPIRIVSQIHYLPIEEAKAIPEEDLWIQRIAKPIFAALGAIYQLTIQRAWGYLLLLKAFCNKIFYSPPKEKQKEGPAPIVVSNVTVAALAQDKQLVLEISLSDQSEELEAIISTPVPVEEEQRVDVAAAPQSPLKEEPAQGAAAGLSERSQALDFMDLLDEKTFSELFPFEDNRLKRPPLTPRRQAMIDEMIWGGSDSSNYRWSPKANERTALRRLSRTPEN